MINLNLFFSCDNGWNNGCNPCSNHTCGSGVRRIYINTLTGITGPTGATGATGPAGTPGATGPTGPTEQLS